MWAKGAFLYSPKPIFMNVLKIYVGFLLIVLFTAYNVSAQEVSSDSIKAIERQQNELLQEEARLKAKQDSLSRERAKLEAEQRRLEEAAKPQVVVTPPVTTQSQTPERVGTTIVGINPLHFLVSGIELSLEQVITKKSSIVLTAAYHRMDNVKYENNTSNTTSSYSSASSGGPGNIFLINGNEAYSGTRVQLQYRGYLFEDFPVLKGLHLGPYVFYKQDEATESDQVQLPSLPPYYNPNYAYQYRQYFAQAMGVGIDIGYQIHFLRYLTMNPFVGFGMIIPLSEKLEASKVHIDVLNPYKEGLSLRTGLVLGFMF